MQDCARYVEEMTRLRREIHRRPTGENAFAPQGEAAHAERSGTSKKLGIGQDGGLLVGQAIEPGHGLPQRAKPVAQLGERRAFVALAAGAHRLADYG